MLISTRLFEVCVHNGSRERNLEWRRAHYSTTNYGPLTRLTLFNLYSFFYSLKHKHARTHTQVNIEQDNIFKCLFKQKKGNK